MLLSADELDSSWPETVMAVVFGFGFLVLLTVLFIALLRAYVEFRKARVAAGREDQLHDLVQRFEELSKTTLDSQQRTAAELTELRGTVGSIERLLRSVD